MSESRFWGTAAAIASSPVAVAAGVVNGAYQAATGSGPFADGFETAERAVVQAAEKFGTEHGETITKATITGVIGVIIKVGSDVVRRS